MEPNTANETEKSLEIRIDGNEVDEDPILLRLIYAIVFYFIFVLSRFVLATLAIVQFFHILLTETYQEDMMRFSRSTTRYLTQLVAYLTWVSNRKPFPFSDWPSDENQQQAEGE